jgi:hypothetical protein
MRGVEEPPGMTQSKLSQPPITPPQCRSTVHLKDLKLEEQYKFFKKNLVFQINRYRGFNKAICFVS